MSYTKLVTVFSRRERDNLHRQGYWVDKQGNVLSVKEMSYERMEKLVKMLAGWATKEDNPIEYLRNQPILPHVYQRIVHFKMSNFHTEMFKSAMADKLVKVEVKYVAEEVKYCLTHETWGYPSRFSDDTCIWVSCPPPDMESDWELHVTPPTHNDLETSWA